MSSYRITAPTQGVVVPAAPTIFGREPAVWVSLIEAVLTILLAFSLGISQTTFGPIMAVVVAAAGAFTAWATRDTMLGVLIGLSKAALICAAVYGLTLTDAQTGALIGTVTLLIGFFHRTQTSPAPGLTPEEFADKYVAGLPTNVSPAIPEQLPVEPKNKA